MRLHLLTWGIKTSLIEYVDDMEGEIQVTAPARRQGDVFVFPRGTARSLRQDGDTIPFAGEVRLRAHGGLLDIGISSPRVRLGATEGSLDIVTTDGSRLTVAELDRPRETADGQIWEASLDPAGVRLFGRTYPRGTELAPVTLLRADGHPGSPSTR